MAEERETLMNAEIAFANRKYNEALIWYQKALEETPDDIYVLTRAGSICVPLGRFEEALKYFGHAKELDPNNGDVVFNYANACFFNKDNVVAFEGYVEAERLGCSEDVTPRLYYQLALINSIRQDAKNALIYLHKCEEVDKAGTIALTTDFISEKIKLYMFLEDYTHAEFCAAQLVAAQPSELKNYMVYFGILMAHKNYDTAEKVLSDAMKYAASSVDERITIVLQQAALLMAKGESNVADKKACCSSAISLLKKAIHSHCINAAQTVQLMMAVAEAYLKNEEYDKTIECLMHILSLTDHPKFTVDSEVSQKNVEDLTSEELEAMIYADIEVIQDKINSGELGYNLGLFTEPIFDDDYQEYRIYEELTVTAPAEKADRKVEKPAAPDELLKGYGLSTDDRERIYFMLLSAYMGEEDFAEARKYALLLKHSGNKYYSYFGLYSSTLLSQKLFGNSDDTVQRYNESIAFFRAKTFEDSTDSLASIFRARLYAECGKFEKAKEMALLLSEEDQKSILEYIEECKKQK